MTLTHHFLTAQAPIYQTTFAERRAGQHNVL